MKTKYNLRLPKELCSKIEREAAKNNLSINQYILYTLTKTITYNEALELLHSKLKKSLDLSIEQILSRIPDRIPLPGDEL